MTKRTVIMAVVFGVIIIGLSASLVTTLNANKSLKDDIVQYKFEVVSLEQVRDTFRSKLIENNIPISITTLWGYPQLLINGEYYYLLDVDENKIPLPFQQIELNGIKAYLVSTKDQIMSDGTMWDWERAKAYKGK